MFFMEISWQLPLGRVHKISAGIVRMYWLLGWCSTRRYWSRRVRIWLSTLTTGPNWPNSSHFSDRCYKSYICHQVLTIWSYSQPPSREGTPISIQRHHRYPQSPRHPQRQRNSQHGRCWRLQFDLSSLPIVKLRSCSWNSSGTSWQGSQPLPQGRK